MTTIISGDTGISPVTASGTSASVDGMTVGRGGGEISTNTAVGASALATNSAGIEVTSVGYQALNLSTGSDNTAFGFKAGAKITTGIENTAIGSAAMANAAAGNDNVAIGYVALYNNTGANNVGIGVSALQLNTSGSSNTSIGFQAGYSNTGDYNTYIGGAAAYSATTGTRNTFLGYGSGTSVTTGDRNTILGRFNGNQGGLDIRTGSNYVVLSDGDGNRPITTGNLATVALQGATIQSGTGISFPATQSASSDANTLDDYEEGTWTVTDASGAGLSISTGFAIYTKVGDMVNAICDITYPTTSNTNYVLFSLPFAGKNYANGFVGYTNYTTTAIYLENNNNSANMNIFNSSFSSITNANFSGKRIICTFVYKVL